MVAFDDCTGDREGFDAVGIYGSLGEPADVFDFMRFFVEHFNEVGAYNLAFFFGVGHTFEVFEEAGRGVDADDVEAEAFVVAEDGCEFVFTEHSVVDENAGEA